MKDCNGMTFEKRLKRIEIRIKESELETLNTRIPQSLKSQFIRDAIREKLQRDNVTKSK